MEDEQSLMLIMLSELIDSHNQKPTRIKSRSWIKRRNDGQRQGVISIFLCAIVLQTDGTTECINNPTFRVESPTKPILGVFSPTNRWSYSTVRLSIRWSRSVYRNSYCWQCYRYTSRDQCVVSPTLCRITDTVVKTSVS